MSFGDGHRSRAYDCAEAFYFQNQACTQLLDIWLVVELVMDCDWLCPAIRLCRLEFQCSPAALATAF